MRRSSLLRCFVLACLCGMSAMAAAQQITPTAMAYRAPLIRVAHAEWGLGAPVATFAAQIQQESGWNPNAVSKVGAQGMAQFMPATAKWWCEKMKMQPADCMPTNPTWAMRSLVQYNLWLYNQIRATDHCQRMAMTLSAYNGGLGWVFKDKKLAFSTGLNPQIWFGQVELANAGRSAANYKENRDYPKRILLKYEPRYLSWGRGSCVSEVYP